MPNTQMKSLLTLTVVFNALFFCALSFLTAKWLYLDSGLVQSPPTMNQDILIGLLTFLGGALPAALILSLFAKKLALRMAIITGALALFFMALHGFLFMLFYFIPYWLYALLTEIGLIALVVIFSTTKSRCCWCKNACAEN